MAIIQLIYVSTAAHELNEQEIRQILDASVMNNNIRHITGMLLYSAGNFMQVLEGEEVDVDECMARIERDPRHHAIVVLSRETVLAREFPQWSMGFRSLSAREAKSWPGYAPFFEFGFRAEKLGAKPGLALDILKTFR
jgi:hypothetical protein